jgi:hypothetical protein
MSKDNGTLNVTVPFEFTFCSLSYLWPKDKNTIFCLPRDTGQAQIWLLFIHVPNLKMGNG